MVKMFKGQVKIADVQKAFDDVINKINDIILNYNKTAYIQDIDYTSGSTSLGASGYTLTVGGMKQFLDACDGYVVGAKPFKISSDKFKITTGQLITKYGIYRLPDSVIDIPTDSKYRTLYYNITTGDYQWTGSGTINTIVKTPKVVGSLLYKSYSDDPDAMRMRYQAYASNILIYRGIESIDIPDKGLKDCTGFLKFDKDRNTAETIKNGTIYMDIINYPHVSCNVTSNDSIGFRMKDSVSSARNGICLGTYNPDTQVFEPKLDIRFRITGWYFWEITINGCKNFAIGGEPRQVPYFENATIGSCTYDTRINWSKYVVMSFGKNFLGALVAKVEFLSEDTGDVVATREIPLPMDIEKYNINTLIPRTWYENECFSTTPDDAILNHPIRAAWYSDDCTVRKSDGSIVGLSDESQTITINEVKVVSSDSASYRICDINPNSDYKLITTINNVQNEAINGTFKITSSSRYVKPVNKGYNGKFYGETVDTSSKPLFVWGQEALSPEGASYQHNTYLFGKLIQWNKFAGHRQLDWWSPLNMLFVPKGVPNPYSYDRTADDFTHWFNVNISKNIKDT